MSIVSRGTKGGSVLVTIAVGGVLAIPVATEAQSRERQTCSRITPGIQPIAAPMSLRIGVRRVFGLALLNFAPTASSRASTLGINLRACSPDAMPVLQRFGQPRTAAKQTALYSSICASAVGLAL